MSEKNWVLASIEPKSDQLNADDMLTGPIVVTVVDVKKGSTKEQPVVIEIDGGYKPYKPCLSMRRVLVAMWGSRPSDWIGKRLRLYCDPNVMFGGMKVGGIRIKSMSDITAPTEMLLTSTRGKKASFSIEVLEAQDAIESRVARAAEAFAKCQTLDELTGLSKKVMELVSVCNAHQAKRLSNAIYDAETRLKQNG